LHWEVSQHARIGFAAGTNVPAEYCPKPTEQHRMVDGGIGPVPELPIRHLVRQQQFAREDERLPDTRRQ